nr:uncharacterized protein LOC111418868 [Onthophagus taurus]
MEKSLIKEVIELYKENKWMDIIDKNPNVTNEEARKLLWVWPSFKNLEFIKKKLNEFNMNGISSIGCGCGLLEWIISKSTRLEVIGYEINEIWWTSKYCIPQFINLTYVENNNYILKSNLALVFCYFNDSEAFNDYVNNYEGNLIFIIGPGEGRGTHTDPSPFKPNFQTNNWVLNDYQEIKTTKDFIAVYIRYNNLIC